MRLTTTDTYHSGTAPKHIEQTKESTRVNLGYLLLDEITKVYDEESGESVKFSVVYREYEKSPYQTQTKDVVVEFRCEAIIKQIEEVAIEYYIESLQVKSGITIKYPRFSRFLNWIKDKLYEDTYSTTTKKK